VGAVLEIEGVTGNVLNREIESNNGNKIFIFLLSSYITSRQVRFITHLSECESYGYNSVVQDT